MTARRTALVTGASTGIGRAVVARLARTGWDVLATVRREQDASALREAFGEGCRPVVADVTDEVAVRRAARAAETWWPRGLDALVNNAGIGVGGPLECVPLAEVRRQLEVNVVGLLAVTQACLPSLRRARGRIVNVGSMSGRVATPLSGPYCASKFAVEGLNDSLRQELGPFGVEVVLVQPGAIESAIWDKSLRYAEAMIAALSPEHRVLYAEAAENVERLLRHQARSAAPADLVARAVEKVLLAERPPTRVPVGKDARLLALLRAALPDRALDGVLLRAMRRASR